MASRAAGFSAKPNNSLAKLMAMGYVNLIHKIVQLKKEIEAGRVVQIKEKLVKNAKMLQSHVDELLSDAHTANFSLGSLPSEGPRLEVQSALCVLHGFLPGSPDKEYLEIHEGILSKSTKFPEVQRIPRYTTWVFLDRNQRMAEDQSVVGRRRIYYDQSGSEALICSDSEDDIAELDEEKREFSEGEDRILWMAFEEHGFDENVVDVVRHFVGGTSSDILQERYNELKLKFKGGHSQGSSEKNVLLQKSLSAALDSFDNLFCRRCLVFDCRLHGCSQTLVYPSEKQSSGSELESRKPCSDQCYLLTGQSTGMLVESSNICSLHHVEDRVVKDNVGSDGAGNTCSLGSDKVEGPTAGAISAATVLVKAYQTMMGRRQSLVDSYVRVEGTQIFNDRIDKKQKNKFAAEVATGSEETGFTKAISSAKTKILDIETHEAINSQLIDKHLMKRLSASSHNSSRQKTSISHTEHSLSDEAYDIYKREGSEQSTAYLENRITLASNSQWKPLEIGLYAKGLEIFGGNSCLIARNLLSGLKTCMEVFNYMHKNEALMSQKKDVVHGSEDMSKANTDSTEQDILLRPKPRAFRKRGRNRRLKYSSKSNVHSSSWKRIGDKSQSCKQYAPCTCESMCGKDCPCIKIGACCEKYCGCSKGCKNRFRGCHCAKSQCRSRQCPCFAANRECDPDVCRNCWVSCGGGSLGEPVKKGDGQCGNMRLLLKQRQRILLARSDVAGWGAFIQKAVNKNDYLGEYTGELISHREADKRGKIYDRANSSFLFDLNDQYVLDACRQGDKLKFANHSSNPNCHCKVMLVAGDHRVGIFAKERIEAMEELFYDYCYGPAQAPEWARKPESAKKDEASPSQGRARKHQSR